MEEAIKDYTKSIELDPKNPDYYNRRGATYRNINNLENAINDYSIAI
jgi:tetratricopeptide (TPR) repeat protein